MHTHTHTHTHTRTVHTAINSSLKIFNYFILNYFMCACMCCAAVAHHTCTGVLVAFKLLGTHAPMMTTTTDNYHNIFLSTCLSSSSKKFGLVSQASITLPPASWSVSWHGRARAIACCLRVGSCATNQNRTWDWWKGACVMAFLEIHSHIDADTNLSGAHLSSCPISCKKRRACRASAQRFCTQSSYAQEMGNLLAERGKRTLFLPTPHVGLFPNNPDSRSLL